MTAVSMYVIPLQLGLLFSKFHLDTKKSLTLLMVMM